MEESVIKNNLNLQVLTDTGWSNFDGVVEKGLGQILEIKLSRSVIKSTPDHKFYTPTLEYIQAKSLRPKMKILTDIGVQNVVSVSLKSDAPVFDLLNVAKNNRFYANGILSSNCQFIIAEETLIDSQRLMVLESKDPIYRQGQIRWFKKPEKGAVYVVALDPAVGTGGDYAAIQVFDSIKCEQVAEWKHNKTRTPEQVKILVDICDYIYGITKDQDNIYYSVENNTVGEATLIALSHYGEENIKGYFLSELGKVRKGFNTNKNSKSTACNKLKNLVEKGKMTIHSQALISELKTFIASANNSYAAKLGEHDDLVSALLIAIRMMMALQVYNDAVSKSMRDYSEDEVVTPLPFISMTSMFNYF